MNEETLPPNIYTSFVIDDKPHCFWDLNISETNKKFIKQIDPNYFEYVANVNFNLLKDKDNKDIDEKIRQYAAVTMRIAYSQALEVFFSFLFATFQAPDCVVGWLLRYSNRDLYEVVRKFRNYQEPYHKFPNKIRGWDSLVEVIFSGISKENRNTISEELKGFSQLWGQFSQDFLDNNFSAEYNSIKHGLRVHMGGFHLMMGPPQETPKEVTPIEKMQTVAYSKFGTTFYISEKINNTPNYVIHTQSRNWDPENYYHGLILLTVSIKNILVYLKNINGIDKNTEYIIPKDKEFSRKPWLKGSGMSMGQKSQINVEKIPLKTKDDILGIYNDSDEK